MFSQKYSQSKCTSVQNYVEIFRETNSWVPLRVPRHCRVNPVCHLKLHRKRRPVLEQSGALGPSAKQTAERLGWQRWHLDNAGTPLGRKAPVPAVPFVLAGVRVLPVVLRNKLVLRSSNTSPSIQIRAIKSMHKRTDCPRQTNFKFVVGTISEVYSTAVEAACGPHAQKRYF